MLFDFDSDVVRPEARANLRELAASLDKYPGTDLLIVGHTDQVGSQAHNQGLAGHRAKAAASYLVSQGVSGSRIATRGLGEAEPVATYPGRFRTRLAHGVESPGITDIRKGVMEIIPTASGNGVRIGKAASGRRVDHPFRGTPNQKVIR